MNTTTVTIFFVGLCLFSNSIPGDPGIHVLLPRIESGTIQTASLYQTSVALPGRGHPSGVEGHEAILLVHKDSVVDDSSWPMAPLNSAVMGLEDFKFVRMQGDRVRFLTEAP